MKLGTAKHICQKWVFLPQWTRGVTYVGSEVWPVSLWGRCGGGGGCGESLWRRWGMGGASVTSETILVSFGGGGSSWWVECALVGEDFWKGQDGDRARGSGRRGANNGRSTEEIRRTSAEENGYNKRVNNMLLTRFLVNFRDLKQNLMDSWIQWWKNWENCKWVVTKGMRLWKK